MKYIAFIVDVFRYTVGEFVFLGAVMLIYRIATDSSSEPIPENYVVMYQLAVTASTIGNK